MTRDERLARNETFYRDANEVTEQDSPGWGELRFHCECSTRGCVDRVALAKPEYEHVRANADHFLVVPGHETPEIELVVERFPGYLIVAKIGEAEEYADETDPRA
jgi:hypothetical protein